MKNMRRLSGCVPREPLNSVYSTDCD